MAKLAPDYVVASLVQRGVPQHIAQGVVMNFQDESGLNTGIQEKAPLSGRGGFGLAQWTGPRRIALEDYARSQGKPIDDPDVQLDFFMQENQGPEAPAWKAVMAAPTAQDAAIAFVNEWERPASRHAAERSARYMGQGPGEGAGRFGGTGLGTPADVSDSPSEAGGARFGGAGLGQPTVNPYELLAKKDKKKKSGWGAFGEGMADAATAMAKAGQGFGYNVPAQPGPARVDVPSTSIDPQQAEMRRQQLAMAMQRLNQGALF